MKKQVQSHFRYIDSILYMSFYLQVKILDAISVTKTVFQKDEFLAILQIDSRTPELQNSRTPESKLYCCKLKNIKLL